MEGVGGVQDRGCTSGIMGRDAAAGGGEATSRPVTWPIWWWWWWFWEEGGSSAYPDWTAQVEKAPGSSFKRTQTSFRPSLMIDEEFRGVALPRRGEGTTAYQAWRMRRVNAGGGWGWGWRGEGVRGGIYLRQPLDEEPTDSQSQHPNLQRRRT